MFNPYDYYVTPEEYKIAKSNGISTRRVNVRIRGFSWEKQKAITTPVQKRNDRSRATVIAKEHGITYQQLKSRLNQGWDERRAATTPLRDAEGIKQNALRMIEMNRKYPREIIDRASINGISYDTVTYRLRKGWSVERATTLPPSTSNGMMRLKEIYGEDYLKNLIKRLFIKK